MTKKKWIVVIVLLITAVTGKSQTSNMHLVDQILSGYSCKVFSDKPVIDNEIELTLKCGLKSPSARNRQPWVFTVVKDLDLSREMIPDMGEGNVLIVISGTESWPWSTYLYRSHQ